MKRHYLILSAVVVVLAGANVWRWFGNDVDTERPMGKSSVHIRPDDLQLYGLDPTEFNAVLRRDLFRAKVTVVTVRPKPKVQEAPPPPPEKSPEEVAREGAQAMLAQFKFLGVAFREERRQALLVKGDQMFQVSVGDRVADRFVVEAITVDTISLKDPETDISRQIQLSGSQN